jgi:hypothetical protein
VHAGLLQGVVPLMHAPTPPAVATHKQPVPPLLHGTNLEHEAPSHTGVWHLPLLHSCPALHVLPQAPQLAGSSRRLLHVSGVVPQRDGVEPEQGQTVVVAVAIVMTVVDGVTVSVAAGAVV